MNKKRHGGPAPVPPENRSQGIPDQPLDSDDVCPDDETEAGFSDQDPKRGLGNFGGAGEHPRQQYAQPGKGKRPAK